jgi:hypothetical protein
MDTQRPFIIESTFLLLLEIFEGCKNRAHTVKRIIIAHLVFYCGLWASLANHRASRAGFFDVFTDNLWAWSLTWGACRYFGWRNTHVNTWWAARYRTFGDIETHVWHGRNIGFQNVF